VETRVDTRRHTSMIHTFNFRIAQLGRTRLARDGRSAFLLGTAAEDLASWANPFRGCCAKLVFTGTDAKDGAQDRYRTA
jgi:hypothetical protein